MANHGIILDSLHPYLFLSSPLSLLYPPHTQTAAYFLLLLAIHPLYSLWTNLSITALSNTAATSHLWLFNLHSLKFNKFKIHFLGLTSHNSSVCSYLWLVAILLDNMETERFHQCRKFCGIALLWHCFSSSKVWTVESSISTFNIISPTSYPTHLDQLHAQCEPHLFPGGSHPVSQKAG